MNHRTSQLLNRLRDLERRTRPTEPEVVAALATRWDELPDHVRTPGQLMGRRLTGCEGTHGVFPACDFACKPCYHSADANRVRVDGRHTVAAVDQQMAYLRATRGPGQHAQLIGGEVTLLSPEDHAEALEVMHRHQRFPMSFTHGDFDYDYLERLALRPDGSRRFDVLAFAVHIDTTMHGRRGAEHPTDERSLNPFRQRFIDMFARLNREHGVRSHLAHNMTVTPANRGQIAEVVRDCRAMGFRVFSFHPAAYVGNDRRWEADYRALSDDDVWDQIEQGVGARLPYRALQMGDLRCNRATWGIWVDDRYVPVLDDADPRDLEARDAFLRAFPGNYLYVARPIAAARIVRTVLAHRRDLPLLVSWARRLVRRAGGLRAFRHGLHPTTYVMHSFIDAADVAPAWELLQRGVVADDPIVRANQERLQACSYAMAHPETGQIVPACVQHGVLDCQENIQLAVLLPRVRRRTPAIPTEIGLNVGDLVPEIELPDQDGITWRLSEQRGRPVILIFHRHLMCLPCQEHIRELTARAEDLGDASVAVVTFAQRGRLREFREFLGTPFPVLADTDLMTYRLFELERAPWRRIYNRGTLALYWRLLRSGRRIRRPTEDTRQLGADAVIGPDGRLVYLDRPPSPDTRPPVDDLIAAVVASRPPDDERPRRNKEV